MTYLSFDRYCSEIVAQTGLLESTIKGADLTVPVPSCPGWNVGQLMRHLGGAQRWAGRVVRTRAAQPVPDEHFRVALCRGALPACRTISVRSSPRRSMP